MTTTFPVSTPWPGETAPHREQLLEQWRALLGNDGVLDGAAAARRHGANTEAMKRRLSAVLLPETVEQVAALVRSAARARIALYPVSTGRNWGYGTALPPADDCALVDLSRMNRISACDSDLGTVTVQPGVTQQYLADYLEERQLPYMVPVTGAGPNCSVLGNALERGYGLTPQSDHFAALTGLEAVLPDGQVYRSPLAALGAESAAAAFKWGVGPYLDGLFAQGNFGIVTAGTIALARRPQCVESFFFQLNGDAEVAAAVPALQATLRAAGTVVGGVQFMNAQRLLAMLAPYPRDQVADGQTMTSDLLNDLMRQHGVAPWIGVGALYGDASVVRAARSVVRRHLGRQARRLTFVGDGRIRLLQRLARWLPGSWGRRCRRQVERVAALRGYQTGRPSTEALALAYWKSGRPGTNRQPARDGCGLLWYAPLVPMKAPPVRDYLSLVRRICAAHRMEPVLTLTGLSDRCFDSTVPLLFDPGDPQAVARAHACHAELLDAGRRAGFFPYRLGIQAQPYLASFYTVAGRLAAVLKDAIDPQGIIAPGRYVRCAPLESGVQCAANQGVCTAGN